MDNKKEKEIGAFLLNLYDNKKKIEKFEDELNELYKENENLLDNEELIEDVHNYFIELYGKEMGDDFYAIMIYGTQPLSLKRFKRCFKCTSYYLSLTDFEISEEQARAYDFTDYIATRLSHYPGVSENFDDVNVSIFVSKDFDREKEKDDMIKNFEATHFIKATILSFLSIEPRSHEEVVSKFRDHFERLYNDVSEKFERRTANGNEQDIEAISLEARLDEYEYILHRLDEL